MPGQAPDPAVLPRYGLLREDDRRALLRLVEGCLAGEMTCALPGASGQLERKG